MLDVRLFGKFQVKLDDQPIDVPSRPMQALFAYLILNTGTKFRREQLAGLFWPDSDEKNARNYLRQTLWRLGQAIGKHHFVTDKLTIGFNPEVEYVTDVKTLQQGDAEQLSTDQLVESVSVYSGVLLPGFYDSWVIIEQERLQVIYETRMELLLERLIEAGRWREVRQWAETWISHGRIPEAAYRALMQALAGNGDLAGVNAVYNRLTEALEEEIGVEPSIETQALFQKIRAGEGSAEIRVGQPDSPPPLQLPFQATTFIGRRKELDELVKLLESTDVRLVNIQGMGGIGKTRLAIETASRLQGAFSDGIFFVPLAPLEDPSLIASSIANTVMPTGSAEERAYGFEKRHLFETLREKKILLVMDNLEHLSQGFSIISELLRSTRNAKILTTSRERLKVMGETVYPVGNLGLPPADQRISISDLKKTDALQMFAVSARRANPNFAITEDNLEAVIQVCRLVGGLPLGIEMAASWVELLTPAEIGKEIQSNRDFLVANSEDIPDRQQSIRSIFTATLKRLEPDQQTAFLKLSVFHGGFTREAAEEVAGASLRTLMALVNKSLLKPDLTGRYAIHELLRQYGNEALEHSGEEDDTHDRHLNYFLKLAETQSALFESSELGNALDALEIEHDNLRAALAWSLVKKENTELGLQLVSKLGSFWHWRGYWTEGSAHLTRALNHSKSSDRLPARGSALYEAGGLAYVQGDFSASRIWLSESIAVYKDLGAPYLANLGHALFMLGDTETGMGHYPHALEVIQEGLDIMRDINDQAGIGRGLWKLGWCYGRQGAHAQAAELFQDAVPIFRELENKDGASMAQAGLGEVLLRLGDTRKARVLLEESLALRRDLRDIWGVAASLGTLAWADILEGNFPASEIKLRESIKIRNEIDDKGGIAWCLEKFAEIALKRGLADHSRESTSDFRYAARLFGTAQGLRESIKSVIDQADLADYEQLVKDLTENLEPSIFEEEWEKGRLMDLDTAIKIALGLQSLN